jgi:hypothetical protein
MVCLKNAISITPFLSSFWTYFCPWLMALSALLRLRQEKALFVTVRPSSSGITFETVKTAAR